MLPEATVRHIDLAIRQHRSFALALMPGSELPLWFENGTCRELSPDGPLTDTPYSFEFSPWLGKFSGRGIIGKMPVVSEEMDVQIRSTSKEEYLKAVTDVICQCRERDGKTVYSRIICGMTADDGRTGWGKIAHRFFSRFPLTFRFMFYTPGTKGWMGATPELLLEFDKMTGAFHTVAFAGTRKANGSHQWDAKNIHENRIVSDYILSKLNEIGIKATASELSTVNYGSIEHLCSHIEGITGTGRLSEIIDAINPTPALCGFPKQSAIDDICRFERHKRHCYGGFVAVNGHNTYNAYVNLRCVHFDDTKYAIYGGGGIMPESIPLSEYEETEAKTSFLQTLLGHCG